MVKFTATPLKGYSSEFEITLLEFFGKKIRISAIFDFNIQTPTYKESSALLVFRARDSNEPSTSPTAFSFSHQSRWRIDLSKIKTFEDYLKTLNPSQLRNYKKTLKRFHEHHCTFMLIDRDWSEYAEKAYQLYANVAKRHPPAIYDLKFFKQIAKRSEYKFLLAQHEENIIAAAVILEEGDCLHAVTCGLDYQHSTKCYAYSYITYMFLHYAIESGKYTLADAGLTADDAKRILGFKKVDYTLDIISNVRPIKWLLKIAEWLAKQKETFSHALF